MWTMARRPGLDHGESCEPRLYGARKMWHQLHRDGVPGPCGEPVARCTVEG